MPLYLGNYWALWSSVWKSTFTFLGPLLFSSSSANSVWNLIHIKIQCYSPPKGKPRCRGYLDGHHTPFFWSHSQTKLYTQLWPKPEFWQWKVVDMIGLAHKTQSGIHPSLFLPLSASQILPWGRGDTKQKEPGSLSD